MSDVSGVACVNPIFQAVSHGCSVMKPLEYIGRLTRDDAKGSIRVIEVANNLKNSRHTREQLKGNGLDEIYVSNCNDGKSYLIVGRMLYSYCDIIEGGRIKFQLGKNGPRIRGTLEWVNVQDSPRGLLQVIGKATKVRLEKNPPTKFDKLSGLVAPDAQTGGIPARSSGPTT